MKRQRESTRNKRAAAASNDVVASLRPSEAVEGGGLPSNFVGEIVTAEFIWWNYGGKNDVEVPAAHLTIYNEDAGEDIEQYWSAGSSKSFEPSEDGKFLVSIDGTAAIRKESNLNLLLASMVTAGMPEDEIEDDITFMEGLRFYWERVDAPERKGLANNQKKGGFKPQVLIVTEYLMEEEEEKPKSAASRKAASGSSSSRSGRSNKAAAAEAEAEPKKPSRSAKKGSTAKKAEKSDDLSVEAADILGEMAEANPDGVEKRKIPSALLKIASYKKHNDRNALLEIIFDDEFLETKEAWDYEDGVVYPLA